MKSDKSHYVGMREKIRHYQSEPHQLSVAFFLRNNNVIKMVWCLLWVASAVERIEMCFFSQQGAPRRFLFSLMFLMLTSISSAVSKDSGRRQFRILWTLLTYQKHFIVKFHCKPIRKIFGEPPNVQIIKGKATRKVQKCHYQIK